MSFDRFTDLQTGIEFRSRIGGKINPRSYCDDPDIGPVGVYIAKEPVCKLSLSPLVQFINTNIAWDIGNSASSTSTVDTFDIDWGGSTDIGDLSSQDFSSDPTSGNVQYDTPGTYLVEAYVTDLLGARSKRCKTQVTILDDAAFLNAQRLYVGTTSGGLYTIDPDGTIAQSNTGLSGNHANFRALRLNPWFKDLALSQQHLWATTQDGVADSIDGGSNWSVISEATLGTPANDAGDSPAPSASDPDNIDIAFDPQSVTRIYLSRTTATRAWLYYTDDYGANWSNVQVGY